MITRMKHLLLTAGMLLLASFFVMPQTALAAGVNPGDAVKDGVNSAGGASANKNTLNTSLKQVVNILLFILGAIAVIMIVVGGIRYALSAGDQSAITAAKNTILYAVVGLVVAMLAYAIVNFVVDAFK